MIIQLHTSKYSVAAMVVMVVMENLDHVDPQVQMAVMERRERKEILVSQAPLDPGVGVSPTPGGDGPPVLIQKALNWFMKVELLEHTTLTKEELMSTSAYHMSLFTSRSLHQEYKDILHCMVLSMNPGMVNH